MSTAMRLAAQMSGRGAGSISPAAAAPKLSQIGNARLAPNPVMAPGMAPA